MAFGKVLKKTREKEGYTQALLAKAIGFSHARIICDFESERKLPKAIDILRLARCLNQPDKKFLRLASIDWKKKNPYNQPVNQIKS